MIENVIWLPCIDCGEMETWEPNQRCGPCEKDFIDPDGAFTEDMKNPASLRRDAMLAAETNVLRNSSSCPD